MVVLLLATAILVDYNITQTAAKSKQLATENLKILLQSQQKFALPEDTSYIPAALDQSTLVTVVARNQPSVIRIGAIYCADITLSSARAVANFADNCSGRVGSGSFISSDGYIASSGHVISVTPLRSLIDTLNEPADINRYLGYLVASRLMSARVASNIETGLANGNTDAQTSLDATIDLIPVGQIFAANSTTKYAIQLSNQPIKLDQTTNRLSFNYTDTVIKAKLIDMDYDQTTSDQALSTGEFTSSDVALLKATGSFPYISLGTIDNIRAGDQLTAIGFPALIDGVDPDLTQAVPSITQGKVKEIRFDSPQKVRKIIGTSVPIGQGNSGGPALNNSGQQVGLNTYSIIECPNLHCYGDGQVRDIADLKALLVKNDVTLQTGGITDDWTKALTSYTSGNYADAVTYLTKVQSAYPANYLVGPLLNVARQQVGTATDTSTSYQAQGLVTIILIILSLSIVVITIALIGLIIIFTGKYHREMRRQEQSA